MVNNYWKSSYKLESNVLNLKTVKDSGVVLVYIIIATFEPFYVCWDYIGR